jgi:uncharacterized protein
LKSAVIAIRDLYGIDNITSDSMLELSRRMQEAVKPGFHLWVLREKAGIDYCMVNCFDLDKAGQRYPLRHWGDTDLLRPDLFADLFINPQGFELVEMETGMDCSTLNGWISVIDSYFKKFAAQCCSVKLALGYRGHLDFDESAPRGEAERLFAEHREHLLPYNEARPLVDYLFFHVLKKAVDYHLPLKFHTGLFSGGADLDAISKNVEHLTRLSVAHPECSIIAMHIASPFQDQLVLAIRQIPNLYADMSWAWIVDPAASRLFLHQTLGAAPITKVMGFGGDFSLVENTYGHLEIARKGIAEVLTEEISSGHMGFDEAAEAGRFLLRGSAERLYAR